MSDHFRECRECGGITYCVETVKFGYRFRCGTCKHEEVDSDYPGDSVCPECTALFYREPESPHYCPDCAPELWGEVA